MINSDTYCKPWNTCDIKTRGIVHCVQNKAYLTNKMSSLNYGVIENAGGVLVRVSSIVLATHLPLSAQTGRVWFLGCSTTSFED